MSDKITPKTVAKTSRMYDSNEQTGNAKSYRKSHNRSPKIVSGRASRSNSSRRWNISSRKSSSKKQNKNRHRSKDSRNSSRRALGFDSIENEKEAKKLAKNDYIFNKYDKLMKAKTDFSHRHHKSKSPSSSSKASLKTKTKRKKNKQPKLVQLMCEDEDTEEALRHRDNTSNSKPPLPRIPSQNLYT